MGTRTQGEGINMYINNFGFIWVYLFTGYRGYLGLGGDLGTRRQGVGTNNLGLILLGDMGGNWG